MCGRFIQSARAETYARLFDAGPAPSAPDNPPRFNIAPTQPVLMVREPVAFRRELVVARWGLVPSWSRGPDSRYSMINARAESVHEKPAYQGPFRTRRCLIPADGFYEWKSSGKTRQPYCIRRQDGRPVAFAGLWDLWKGPDGEELESCSIIVTAADSALEAVHDRMPVMLSADAWDRWLDPSLQQPEAIIPLMGLTDRSELAIYSVSRRVNTPSNEGPDLMSPAEKSSG